MKNYIFSNFNKRGFTLIELLVVIAIIAILTAIVTANFSGAKAKARDAKRISDLAQIQLALEMCFDRANSYPITTALNMPATGASCGSNTLGNFISVIPTSPNPGSYEYASDGSTYTLKVTLETNNNVLIDAPITSTVGSLDCTHTPNYNYCLTPQ